MVVKAIEKQVTHRVKQALRMRSSAEVHIGGKRDHKLTREIQICYGEVVMQKKAWLPVKIISLLLVLLAVPRTASAYYTNMPASVVIGQTDFVSNTPGTGNAKLWTVIRSMLIDPHGRLIVTDNFNHRVLIWNSVPTSDGVPADLVLGQPDFDTVTSNTGGRSASSMSGPNVAYSDGTRLFVSDEKNDRVLIWNTFPTQNGQPADVVVGQPDFTSVGGICNDAKLEKPEGVFVYENKLIVGTGYQHRVLIWNTIPTTNGASADMVLGKTNFTDCSSPNPTTASTLSYPRSIQVDPNGKLIIAGGNRNRVLIWNTFPTQNGQPADVVVGQPDSTSTSAGISASSFSNATAAYSDGKRLFVSDNTNNRILIFNSVPANNGAKADVVIGQPDFTSNLANQGGPVAANTLFQGRSVYVSKGKLFVGDSNARVLIFEDYEATATPGFTVNYPPESSGVKMRLSGNIVMGEYGKFDLRSPEVSINNQGFGPLTNFSKRQHSDHETITEFYHDFEPWAGVAPRNQWTEGDGFTAHFRATSYQSRIETQEAFLFWPFTLDSVNADSAVPVFSFHMPSKNVEHIKSNLDRFEVYIGKEGNFTKYLSRVPVNLVGEDGGVIVSADDHNLIGMVL